jgi:hypothetical protein
MKRILALLVLTTACGGGDATGSNFPALAGSYGATFTVAFSNAIESGSSSVPGTVTLGSPSNSGAFSGSYIITGGGSGTIGGTVRADGGISISEFGDPNADPLESLQILQNEFFWCDFAFAAASPMSGSISGGTLNLTGGISVPCDYVNPTQTVASTISVTVNAVR